jgi:hypothetical protein
MKGSPMIEERTMPISSSLQHEHARRSARLALIFAASGALWPQVSAAHVINPFAEFIGSWRGFGHVIVSDGRSERISCRATYAESDGGKSLSQSLVCASDSYRFDVHSYVVADDRGVQGYWQEASRNVTGRLTGHLEDGQFEGSIVGASFTAQLSLKAAGRKQAVTIAPQGSDIVKVDIILSREG